MTGFGKGNFQIKLVNIKLHSWQNTIQQDRSLSRATTLQKPASEFLGQALQGKKGQIYQIKTTI